MRQELIKDLRHTADALIRIAIELEKEAQEMLPPPSPGLRGDSDRQWVRLALGIHSPSALPAAVKTQAASMVGPDWYPTGSYKIADYRVSETDMTHNYLLDVEMKRGASHG